MLDDQLNMILDTQRDILATQREILGMLGMLAEAIARLEPLSTLAARESLEAQYQRFREAAE